jgi:serine/threonine protein kinase/tetratricopeptide (TPR) repeat protein
MRDWQPDDVLVGKYRIVERIGAGGMGTVHAAVRLSLGDVVAIKSVLPDRSTPRNRARFLREARAVARIRHPNVVQVFDFGESEDGRPFMVMEYVDGPTLAQILTTGRIPIARALELFSDICKAVEAGHRRGVVHRDLKPGNVMLDRSDDGTETVKVLDFGLATMTDEGDVDHSRAGALVGTCAYMSPESIEQSASSPAGDVFSLGVMLYELVTGELPFRGSNAIATIMQICEGTYRPPHEHVPELPAAVGEAIAAALQRSPTARPASPIELAAIATGSPGRTSSMLSMSPSLTDGSPSMVLERVRAREREGTPAPSWDTGQWLERKLQPRPTSAPERTLETLDGSLEMPHEHDTIVHDTGDSQRDSQRVRATLASPPFVGRKLELDTLLELLAASVRDEVPIAIVLGEPGMGRTRLLRRFAELAREGPALVYEGRFWGYDGDRAPAGETFVRMLGGPDQPGTDIFAAGIDRRSGFAALAKRFEDRAGGRSLVLVLDDLHQASSRDLEFLTYLARGGQRAAPIVIVASARNDAARSNAKTELSRWLLQLAGLKARTSLTLPPFDEEQIRAWLEAAFGRLRIRPRDLRRLERVSAGNPYFLSELVRHLVASERIHQAEGENGWVCERLAHDVLPEGVASAVADQLAGLPEPLRNLLETAAVIGEQLRVDVLGRALGVDEDELDELVDDAVARDLLTEVQLEGDADLRFRSATVRQVLYDCLGNRKRKRVHKAVIDALVERDAAGKSERHAKVLAWHYRAVGDWQKTLRFGLLAANQALARHDHDAAELALEHALTAIEALEQAGEGSSARARIDIAALAGALDARVGRFDEGVTRLREARQLLEHRGAALEQTQPDYDSRPLEFLRFDVALSLARCYVGVGQLDKAAEISREAFAMALALTPEQAGGVERRLEAEWEARIHLGHALGRFGDWKNAIAALEPVVESDPLPLLRVLHVVGLRERGWLAARSGDLDAGERHAAQARAEAKACAEPLAEYCAASVTAITCSARGESRLAIHHYRDALRRARALSLRRREMIEQANLCMTLVDVGEYDEAFQHMLSVRAICSELGDAASAADATVGLGRILRGRGDIDQAIECFRRGHEACATIGRHEYAAIALLELGRCELDRGHWAAARAVLQLAGVAFAELRSLLQWEVEFALARAARGLGDEEAAFESASAALALLEKRRAATTGTVRDTVDRGLLQIREFLDAAPEPSQ